MNKKILLILLLLGICTASYAQKIPVRFFKPGFSNVSGRVNMKVLQNNLLTSTRQAGITPRKQLKQEIAKANLIKSVFRAFPKDNPNDLVFSGFVFKTTYQGKEEIFGAIAQHAVSSQNDFGTLGETFTARMVQGDQTIDIPAEIVKMTSPTMPDIALVKFRPEDEHLLTPLTLAKQEPAPAEPLQMLGFGNGKLSHLTNSPLWENSMISLRFPMAGERLDWPGLCGSPVLNSAGEVVGTFTGVARKYPSPQANLPQAETSADSGKPPFTGYATKNSYLQTLVSAYHRETEGSTFPLILGEDKIIELAEDEFVAIVILRNESGNILFKKDVQKKFPYSAVMEHLPNARYVELYIDYVWWNGRTLVEGSPFLNGMRHVVYDRQTKEMLPNADDF